MRLAGEKRHRKAPSICRDGTRWDDISAVFEWEDTGASQTAGHCKTRKIDDAVNPAAQRATPDKGKVLL